MISEAGLTATELRSNLGGPSGNPNQMLRVAPRPGSDDVLESMPDWAFAQWLMGRPRQTYLEYSHLLEQHERMLMIERSRAGSGIGQPIPDESAATCLVSPQTMSSRAVSSVGPEAVSTPVGPRSRSLDRFIED